MVRLRSGRLSPAASLLLATLASLAICGSGSDGLGIVQSKATALIYNGDTPSSSRFPYAALIFNESAPMCTGVLITRSAVLTSGRCATMSKPEFVKVGAWDYMMDMWQRPDGYESKRVTKVVLHPDFLYTETSLKNNLAVLLLDSPVKSSRAPVKLVAATAPEPAAGTILQTFGWGYAGSGVGSVDLAIASRILQQTSAKVLARAPCVAGIAAFAKRSGFTLVDLNKGTEMCTDSPSNKYGTGPCGNGDRGAPLLQLGSSALLDTIVAVVSENLICGAAPSTWTWLPPFLPWISRTVGPAALRAAG